MKGERELRVIKLLEREGAVHFALECAREIDSGKLVPDRSGSGPVAINEVKDIYSTRARLALKQKSPIYGFDELLSNLEKTDRKLVEIHTVDGDTLTYIVFTDDKCEVLFGIIAIGEN